MSTGAGSGGTRDGVGVGDRHRDARPDPLARNASGGWRAWSPPSGPPSRAPTGRMPPLPGLGRLSSGDGAEWSASAARVHYLGWLPAKRAVHPPRCARCGRTPSSAARGPTQGRGHEM